MTNLQRNQKLTRYNFILFFVQIILLSISLIVFLGWGTLTVKAYQSDYDNAFDRIVIVYISPIVSILALGSIIINKL